MEDKTIVYQFTNIVGALKWILASPLFGDHIKRIDMLTLLDESAFSIRMKESKFKEMDEWTSILPTFKNTNENKLYLMFYYRIFLGLKLGIRPAELQFVGIAHLNNTMVTTDPDGKSREIFFAMHPTEMRHYDARISMGRNDLLYVGANLESYLLPFVVVFSGPKPTQLTYNLSNHPCHYFDASKVVVQK
jgi:integrase